ncbi:uncharacterized protein LOC116932420 [Daphnia magna]|uniref:uncharacterized protein LOC116932420 n=1 Tax=Daphnia magna TaxID=35525 RepID=UPI001E1BC7DD|nr:uncharacterized protein LOC116932420 [Daphnia magna]
MAKKGIAGAFLGWIKEFLTGRSMSVRIGSITSIPAPVENGVPQGAVLSPILFNIILIDFLSSTPETKISLYADDVLLYSMVKRPADAEVTLQPVLDKVRRWGRKWKFSFTPNKNAMVVFTRAYKPGNDPLLYLDGHRIPSQPTFNFLELWFDSKLLWKSHIDHVTNRFLKLKNLFSILTRSKAGPTTQTLVLLHKSLVRSLMDYGAIAYGAASKTNLERVDVVGRAILRNILGANLSTPVEMLYAETGTESLSWRTKLLTRKYLINLSHKPNNPIHKPFVQLATTTTPWKPRSTPGLIKELDFVKSLGISLFPHQLLLPSTHKYPPPSRPPDCKTSWFPLNKEQAMACRHRTTNLFNSFNSSAPVTSIRAYTDGSKSSSPETTTCAIFVLTLNIEHAWTLTKGSSIFTAEVTAIYQALKLIYDMDDCPPEVIIYSDSSSAITAISSNSLSENEAVTATRKIIASLKSSGTRTSLTWIPSHTGIEGNERADRLAAMECNTQDGERVNNSLSPKEMVSIIRANWAINLLRDQKTCKKSCIQMRPRLGTIKWHQHGNRQVAICLHRLRSGHNRLNAFNHRIDPEADPSCRFGCAAIENTRHILESCPRNEEFRLKIRQFFSDRNLELNANTILGLNPAVDTDSQFKIRNLTTQFLTQSVLINII